MPDDAGEFEDDADFVEGYSAPLPPDDRLWRHPSELGRELAGDELSAAHRRRAARRTREAYQRALLTAGPVRAGSWSAGLAGALLATGLVLVGTHLAASMRQTGNGLKGAGSDIAATTTAIVATGIQSTRFSADKAEIAPLGSGGIGLQLAKAAERVHAATVMVQATQGLRRQQFAGLVVGADCLVVAPATLVSAAETIDLTLPDGRIVAAKVVGIDTQAGIAVLRCEVQHMASITDVTESTSPHQMVALVYDAQPEAIGVTVGLVVASDQRVLLGGDTPLLDTMSTDIPATADGAGIVDGDGDVVGVVVGSMAGTAVATPTWLAVSVARRLAGSESPTHGWLGIDGASLTRNGEPAGVEVQAVAPASAAAKAGLEPGDVIKGIDGLGTASLVALQARLYCLSSGQAAEIDVQRGKRSLVRKAMLDHAPAA